jgi:hypothetical protein
MPSRADIGVPQHCMCHDLPVLFLDEVLGLRFSYLFF